MKNLLAMDTGGTFTDAVLVDEKGNRFIGKAFSTPQDFSIGALHALIDAIETAGQGVAEAFNNTALICHGTTVTTNALIERQGVKTGLLITKGFEDTLEIGRVVARTVGLDEKDVANFQKASRPDPIVPVTLTRAVTERVDFSGQIITPLKEEDVLAVTAELVSEGIEALAVSLLWSFRNPAHEQRIQELLRQHYPQLHVVVSSELIPVIGEYERANTTAINCYLGPILANYLAKLEEGLKEQSCKAELLVMQSVGGLSPAAEVRKVSVSTLYSGPVGGVIASQMLGKKIGENNIITTDMGGTTFDVGLIVSGTAQISPTTIVNRYITQVPAVEVVSVGAGGGSIAWIDNPSALRVGPRSAGAFPGPACYNRGGSDPTVTDADVVLGYINPGNFLGGRVKLDSDLSYKAIRERIAAPLNISVVQAAAGIYEIVNAHMADLIRKMSIERGYDPREFTLFAFGGGGPVHCTAFGPELGVKKVVIPPDPHVFSAVGIAESDVKHSFSQSYPVVIDKNFSNMNLQGVNAIFEMLAKRAEEQLVKDGVHSRAVLTKSVEMRYRGQVHEIMVPINANGDLTIKDFEKLIESYQKKYEMLYGSGSASHNALMEIITFRVESFAATGFKALVKAHAYGSCDASHAQRGQRSVYWPSERRYVETNVYDGDVLCPGNKVQGPAVIEMGGTSIPLFPGQALMVDEYNCFLITWK